MINQCKLLSYLSGAVDGEARVSVEAGDARHINDAA